MRRTLRSAAWAAAALCLLAASAAFAAEAPHDRPGPAADRLIFSAFDVDRAPRDLAAGRMDLYMFSLKTAAAERLRDDPAYRLYEAPATTLSLVLNPAPAPPGQLNPFSIREVRQAVQFLIDREFIARDIYRGMAVPMISHVSPQDFDYLTIYDLDRGSGIVYDPEYGRQRIAAAMEAAGAVLQDGVWHYEGRPVRITLIARVEDERRDIGNLLRTELEAAGFMVGMTFAPFAAATLRVYASDPQTFQWHIYTEGWGRSAPQRYDFGTINQMYAPWLGNMPGWQEVGFWQYQHEELDELGQKLYRGEFASLEERNGIYRRMSQLGLDESVRIWLATAVNSFPARADLVGVTQDVVAGPRSPWTFREAYAPGSSDVRVGHLWVWTERTAWNPVGGMGDVYSVDIWRYLHDPPLWNHPFTGVPMPVRARYEVETAGPEGRLPVPADAVLWNAAADRWEPVGAGASAVSKVTFDYSGYFDGVWHHGQPITMADALYGIAQSYELAYDPDKTRIEVSLGVTARPYLETFRGYRLLDDRRIEVYVDFWHFEEAYIASYAAPSGLSMPWEMLAAMDDLVFNQRRAAYSDTAAARFNVLWLSLALENHAFQVNRTLQQLAQQAAVPAGVFEIGGRSLVGPDEARARYEAASRWFEERGHLVISNGPFHLAAYDPRAQYAELQAFRDPTYPFRPGDWRFGEPPALEIERPQAFEVASGEAATLSVRVNGPGALGLRYLLFDPVTGAVVDSGEAEQAGGAGRFTVPFSKELTAGLFPGLYRLYLAAYSDAAAQVSEVDVDVIVGL